MGFTPYNVSKNSFQSIHNFCVVVVFAEQNVSKNSFQSIHNRPISVENFRSNVSKNSFQSIHNPAVSVEISSANVSKNSFQSIHNFLNESNVRSKMYQRTPSNQFTTCRFCAGFRCKCIKELLPINSQLWSGCYVGGGECIKELLPINSQLPLAAAIA